MVKKILLFTAFAVAIMSFGGTTRSVHAATLSPAQAAVLSQQLDVAKATLVNLEMNAGLVPQGDNALSGATAPAIQSGAAAVTTSLPTQTGTKLSASDAASFSTTLGALATALKGLSAQISENPNMTPAQTQGVVATLSGMKSTLVAMEASLNASAPVAANTHVSASAPAIAKAPKKQPTVAVNQQTGSLAPATVAPQASAAPTPAASTPTQAAQVFSLVSFTRTHWPTIAIILLIIIMLAILFWPQSEGSEGSAQTVYSSHSEDTGNSAGVAPKITVMQQHQEQKKKTA